MSDTPNTSPFAALTYQEQQDRWREWRSRQLIYRSADDLPPVELPASEELPAPAPRPPVVPAPTRHRQLDSVLLKHQSAMKRASTWHSASARE